MQIKPIARIRSGFPEKFGIPRQSGLIDTQSMIVFEEEYRNADALRGLDGYSHLWLIWGFSLNEKKSWSPTVRPPRLGGNKRVGVFATRSPFRPNGLGLSCVKLEKIESNAEGKILVVSGADITDGTPIYDIKPYLPYVDSVPEACGGFSDEHKEYFLEVEFYASIKENLSEVQLQEIKEILSLDPRPSYQDDKDRVYGLSFGGFEIKFKCDGIKIIVTEILKGDKI